jgi:spermidine synthase
MAPRLQPGAIVAAAVMVALPSTEREREVPRSAEPRAAHRRLYLVVFSVGVSTLGAEIAAARLLAPFFGASTIVWANTIATVLVALSIGYWLGGSIADRRPHVEDLCRWVLIGACLVALVPLVAQPFLSTSVEAFDDIDVGAALGSLVGVLVLVAVPILVLGAVAPWAIRLRVDSVEDAGRTAGRLYALSTVGSLVGTFAAALVLIPLLGTQRTFIAFALLLAISAASALAPRYALVPAAIAALLLIPPGTTKDLADGRVVAERETEYQYARVVELDDGERRLELNEGQAYHSVYRPRSVLTDNVWDGYLSMPFAVLGRAPRSVAILGNGAGTTVRAYGRYFPATAIDGVEIDPELTELGRRYFGLRDRPGLRLIDDDARPFLRRTDRRYEAIFVDAYRQPYIPFYLTTREVFRLVRARLAPGGTVIVNGGLRDHRREHPDRRRRPRADRPADPRRGAHAARGAAAAVRRDGCRPRPRRARRPRLHRRPRAGRVAHRPLDRQLRGGRERRLTRRLCSSVAWSPTSPRSS